eukprot:CAMPEP_0172706434 /NCGR_PEP_ID=MMETSP1074-20121228/45989_1 /TAXON_ID=2916 /ORGANISM="Ceratium fusus, Strain PA161109" /LENGTH=390 /DNA_ID=CAMNT_0013529009 /DNA_START=30 /DNA_END=1202 /DNA_ORIENTATION=-
MSSGSLSSNAGTLVRWQAEADEHSRDSTLEDSACLLDHSRESEPRAVSTRFHGRRVIHQACLVAKISTLVMVVMAVALVPLTLFTQRKVGLSQKLDLVATVPSEEGEGRYMPHVQLRNDEADLCLDWGNVIVTVQDCNHKKPTQLWTYATQEHRLASVAGRCLDSGGKYVHTWDCQSPTPSHQQWVYRKSTKQLIRFINTDAHCLATDGSAVKMPPCKKHPDPEQEWELEDIMDKVLALGHETTGSSASEGSNISDSLSEPNLLESEFVELVQVKHHEGICLVSGDNVHMHACNISDRRQQWTHDMSTGQFQDVNGSCLDAGSPDLRAKCRASDANQAWGINTMTRHIRTHKGFCLDAWWPKKEGSAVTLQPCKHEDTNQEWNLEQIRAE